MKKRIEIQAYIQGIHCIIKATTGIKDGDSWWNLLFPGRKKKRFLFHWFPLLCFLACILYLFICRPLWKFFSLAYFLLLYLRSLQNIQNTSPRQPQHMMYICLALHSGQRLQFSSVTLLSLLTCFFSFFFSLFLFGCCFRNLNRWGGGGPILCTHIGARRHIIMLRGHTRAVTRQSGESCVVFSLHGQVYVRTAVSLLFFRFRIPHSIEQHWKSLLVYSVTWHHVGIWLNVCCTENQEVSPFNLFLLHSGVEEGNARIRPSVQVAQLWKKKILLFVPIKKTNLMVSVPLSVKGAVCLSFRKDAEAILHVLPCQWVVGWSFSACHTFLELCIKAVFMHFYGELTTFKKKGEEDGFTELTWCNLNIYKAPFLYKKWFYSGINKMD